MKFYWVPRLPFSGVVLIYVFVSSCLGVVMAWLFIAQLSIYLAARKL